MLATQANHVIHDAKLVRNCIVRIKSYQANAVKGKRYARPPAADGAFSRLLASWSSSTSR